MRIIGGVGTTVGVGVTPTPDPVPTPNPVPTPDPTPVPETTTEAVNAESLRRISAGFLYDNHVFDLDFKSQMRIAGAATRAGFAMDRGYTHDDYYWFESEKPFTWITKSNRIIPVDAPTMFGMGEAVIRWEAAHVSAGRSLKDRPEGIPNDFRDDKYWPPVAREPVSVVEVVEDSQEPLSEEPESDG